MTRQLRPLPTLFAGCWLALVLAMAATNVQAAPSRLVADLSQSRVDITSGYHGTELLLFGAYEGVPGDELVLIVEGPATDIVQRRKEKKAGIWVNVETFIWQQAPSFYHMFSTAAFDRIADADVRRSAEIGPASGGRGDDRTTTAGPTRGTSEQEAGLRRNMTANGLWQSKPSSIITQQDMLFRTMLSLPSNVPTGDYVVRILHFRNGVALSERTTDMNIRKAGMSALIYRFAHDYPVFYGLFAIAFAVASGWLAAVAFRRG